MAAAEDVAAMRQAFETQMQMLREENAAQAARLQALTAEGQAQMQRMQAQLDLQQSQGTDLLQQLNGAQKMLEDAEARRSTAEQQLAEERSRARQSTPSVDIKPDKPPKFDNDSAKWPEWSWEVRNHLATANIGARAAVQFAEGRKDDPISEEEVEQLGWKILSDKLYSLLVSITTAESASIVMNTNPEGHGLEAWRRLAYRFNPPTTSS